MDVIPPKKAKRSRASLKKFHPKGPIPYAVSQPNRFWRIPKGLPADAYWKKRYWRRRITGRGDYSVGSGYDSIGGKIGAGIGGWVGNQAQNLITGLVSGFGDYKVRRNVFASGRLPEVVNASNGGGTIIRYQEFLSDIYTSSTAGAFNIQQWLINPANTQTFPFLSQIAQNYEQYDIEGMLFEFRSTSANALNSTNTALGTVIMATQYDVADPVFSSKMEMLNYEYSSSSKPADNCMHMIECDPRQTTVNELYTTAALSAPANTDARLYFLGRFCIATQGFQAASVNIGELHITYQVRLLKPKIWVSLGKNILYARASANGTVTNAAPLGTTVTQLSGNFTPVFTGTAITFPGTTANYGYAVAIEWYSGASAALTTPALTLAGCSFGFGPYSSPTPNGQTSTSITMYFEIIANGLGAVPTVTFGTGGFAASTSSIIFINQKNISDYGL